MDDKEKEQRLLQMMEEEQKTLHSREMGEKIGANFDSSAAKEGATKKQKSKFILLTSGAVVLIGLICFSIFNQNQDNQIQLLHSEYKALLRDANKISVATERGVVIKEFVDLYREFEYDHEDLTNSLSSKFDDEVRLQFEELDSHIKLAVKSWEAAHVVWKYKLKIADFQEARKSFDKEGMISAGHEAANFRLDSSMDSNLMDLFNGKEIDAIFDEEEILNPEHWSGVISLCFSRASTSLVLAENSLKNIDN